MARGGNDATLDALSTALRAANRLSKDPNSSEDISDQLTPATLASAIKLASPSSEHQDQLMPANVNQSVQSAKHNAKQQTQRNPGFNAESLAMALKVAVHSLLSESGKSAADKDEVSSNAALAAMKATASLVSKGQEDESPVTPEIPARSIRRTKQP